MSSQPALIGLDCGTSSLRGYLIAADGTLIDAVAKPWGIRQLPPGGFAAAYAALRAD
jgi:2-dehydro-3-deoxygalactonokinase